MKELKGLIAILVLALTFWVGYAVCGIVGKTQVKDPQPYAVTDKAEYDGKCYVQTWIEVDVEDYIGLDVGDNFYAD